MLPLLYLPHLEVHVAPATLHLTAIPLFCAILDSRLMFLHIWLLCPAVHSGRDKLFRGAWKLFSSCPIHVLIWHQNGWFWRFDTMVKRKESLLNSAYSWDSSKQQQLLLARRLGVLQVVRKFYLSGVAEEPTSAGHLNLWYWELSRGPISTLRLVIFASRFNELDIEHELSRAPVCVWGGALGVSLLWAAGWDQLVLTLCTFFYLRSM